MKTCLLCGDRLKFIKFKCQDGHVCRTCYEKVSLQFTQTIKSKTKEELLAIYQEEPVADPSKYFEMSRKINQLVLIDDHNKQFCLPNHPKYSMEELQPEYYSFSEVAGCHIEERHVLKKDKKKDLKLGTINVVISLDDGRKNIRNIWLIPKPIQIDSIPYRTMQALANKIAKEVNQMREAESLC
nr:hypothetical protein [uncultured Trichococcus sp.]